MRQIIRKYLFIFTILYCFILSLSIPATIEAENSEWEVVKKNDKMTIYRRHIDGFDIDEFKGIIEAPVRIEVVGMVLENIPGYKNWIDYLAESVLISKKDDDNMIIYQRYNAIWPFHDRDCIARVSVTRNYQTGRFIISLTSATDIDIPEKPKTVRIPDYSGKFIIEYIDREHTRLTYIAKFNMGGSIPAWFANMLSREIPSRVLTGLVSETDKTEYQKAAQTSVLKTKIEASLKNGHLKQ